MWFTMHNWQCRSYIKSTKESGRCVWQCPWPIKTDYILPDEFDLFWQQVLSMQIVCIPIYFPPKHIDCRLCHTVPTAGNLYASFVLLFLAFTDSLCCFPVGISTCVVFNLQYNNIYKSFTQLARHTLQYSKYIYDLYINNPTIWWRSVVKCDYIALW
jgi:hypothetical protein